MEVTPSQTLYINNLNEKIKKDVLKKTLYMLFRQYGNVLEIVACKGVASRGQAFVVFEDVASSTNAMRSKQGFNFYDKPLRIDFARAKSDVIAKKDGTFVPREKRTQQELVSKKRKAGEAALGDMDKSCAAGAASKVKLMVNSVPHNILFAQALPSHCTLEVLSKLFQQYTGFVEVRMVPGKKEIAFIEFGDHIQAGIALQALNGFKLVNSNLDDGDESESQSLHLTYGKQ